MPINDISDIALADELHGLHPQHTDVTLGSDAPRDAAPVVQSPVVPTPGSALTRRLDVLACRQVRILHHRRRRWTFRTIDHLVVCAAGVVVVGALQTRTRPSLQLVGPADGPERERLVAGDRDYSSQVESLLAEVRAVTRALAHAIPEMRTVDVHAVLVATTDDWPARGGAFAVRGVQVLGPDGLSVRIAGPGPLRVAEIELVAAALVRAFPKA